MNIYMLGLTLLGNDLGMSKDVSGLRHMVLVAGHFLLVVFSSKEPYKYGCNISL